MPAAAELEQADKPDSSPMLSASNATKQVITIALDAGHGGEDPGATGHRGSQEKKITLSIAKHLQKVINADSRMQAVLVRGGDYYIDLTRRRTMAREKGADIFVSIHADAFNKKSANGLSVFALSQRGATSAMARALAKKENAADLIGGVSLANKDAVLAQVLVDLSMTNTISESVNLGGRVLKELDKVGRLHSKRVEQASFVVLKSPDIPSILIETGFITNLDEEKKLRTSRYQKKIANAVHRALGEYYDQTPYYNEASYSSPRVASLSSNKRSETTGGGLQRHTVKRGDSLSSIAVKYRTTVAELKRINKLANNTAVLGQRLKLPTASADSASASSKKASEVIHIVTSGDSLSKISARYNVTISALKRAKSLSKDAVYMGQKIKIPGVISAKKMAVKHRVTRGDTLSEIAEQYGVTTNAVMLANGLRSAAVQLGQTLKIPR
ncbi:MAG: N-acetylmuramoyl-L-alanine amidase [Arenicella sp.]|jgi:N-acetylmuramoyl-L-alanine amidase